MKRIVNVTPIIYKNDVVMKSELEEVINSMIKIGSEHGETVKELHNLTDALTNLF